MNHTLELTVAALVIAISLLLIVKATLSRREARREKRAKEEEERLRAEAERLAAEDEKYRVEIERIAAEEAERRIAEAERLAKEEERQRLRRLIAKLLELSPDISRLSDTITTLESFDSGYLMKKDWDALLGYAAPTLDALCLIPENVIRSSGQASQIAYVMERCQDPTFRQRRNNEYKARELEQCSALLSNIDGGKSLDPQQRDAIVTDEYSNLVIAGAGSGKTSVIVGKVKYLVERWGVDPSQILVTSFTRASVNDLESRIEASGIKGVTARTFHALGLGVLGDFAVAQENELERHIITYLSEDLATHPDQASAFLEFFGMWSLVPDESPDAKEAEARMKTLKAQDMHTLKGLVEEARRQDGLDTMQGEQVKSVEELMIANFLFLNGVAYEYERPYDHDIPDEFQDDNHRAYQPDFYLSDYDIWLEHFGIDEDERVPWMKKPVEEQAYLDGIDWKRKVHTACGTRLIESYSWWNKDQDLLNRLEALLRDNGVELVINPQRNAKMYGDLLSDQRFFSSMSQLISTFISLVKSSNQTAPEVDDKARGAYRGNGAMWHRYDLFTRFAWPIMESYQRSLASGPKPQVDFDDMINMAAERIRREGYKDAYRYIIVDEYQDISLSRFGLLSAIRDATGAKLMCVGDDWQAIYRFAGSDVTLFTNFGKLVGHYEEMRLERTYRNTQALVDVASKFVLKNPDQLRKRVVSMMPAQTRPPVATIALSNQQAAFTFAVNDLLATPGDCGEIKVLGRNGRDLERIFPNLKPANGFSFRDPKRNSASEEKYDKVITYRRPGAKPVEIGYMTVHKSKGLQADNVIVIGLVNDRYGFPNMVADDPILELLLADNDQYDYAEERRLFYVALTRAKNRVWLVTGDDAKGLGMSMFVDELHRDNNEESFVLYAPDKAANPAKCPRCGGVLLRRSTPNGDFVSCSNYPFCDKRYRDVRILEDRKVCPSCGGWLTRRTRKDGSGEFYGCTNWPEYCQYTMNLDGTNTRTSESSQTAPNRNDGGYSDVRTGYQQPLRPRKSRRNRSSTPKCPACGAKMVLRTSRYGKFYGCSIYPSCTGKRKYPLQQDT